MKIGPVSRCPRMFLGLLLSSLVVGCASQKPIKEYVYVYDPVPAVLADCPGYTGELVNNGDLAKAYQAEREGRLSCNADKAVLRQWEAGRVKP